MSVDLTKFNLKEMSQSIPFNIVITKADNGYLCEWIEEIADDRIKHERHVIEEGDDEFSQIESFRLLCYYLLMHFGVNNNKHNKKRLFIDIKDNE